MKLTNDILFDLESLKNKFYLRSWGNRGGGGTSTPIIGFISGWEIEDIPPRKVYLDIKVIKISVKYFLLKINI